MIGSTNAVIGSRSVSTVPEFTYTGNYTIIDEGEEGWQVQFLDSGMLNFSSLDSLIDVWLVGGGGGGGGRDYGGGGGGGYVEYAGSISPVIGTEYPIVIGAGGVGTLTGSISGGRGGTSTAFGVSAAGGYGGQFTSWFGGGDGGSGGGAGDSSIGAGRGGSNGSDGYKSGSFVAGKGQGRSTRDWGRYSGTLRSGGGGGGSRLSGPNVGGDGGGGDGGYGGSSSNGVNPTNGWNNYGGGAGGSATYASGKADGGTGIVIIRNHRIDTEFVLFDNTKGGDLTENGWTLRLNPQYYTSTVIISSDYINAHHRRNDSNSNTALLLTNDVFDLSKFASLHCKVYRGGGGTYELPVLCVCTNDGTRVVYIESTTSSSETVQMINIDNLTGGYRIGVYQPGGTNISFSCDSYYTRIWFERQ